MRRKLWMLALAFILLACLPNCRPQQTSTAVPITPTVAVSSDFLDESVHDLSIFNANLEPSAQSVLDAQSGMTLYRIEMEIEPDYSRVFGKQSVTYTNRENEQLAEIYFRLFANALGGKAQISEVSVNAQPINPVYEAGDTAVRVPLQTPLEPGKDITIYMAFEVEIPREMGGTYGLLSYLDGILALDSIYPVIPVYDEKGWQKDAPPPNADLTYNDASLYLVKLTAPSKLVVVSSGTVIQTQELNDQQILTIVAGPARDFYIAASEGYKSSSTGGSGTRVTSYVKGKQELAEVALKTAVNAIQVYSQRLGAYPYAEFDVASTPMLALGIEYPGVTGIATKLFDPDNTVRGLSARIMLESVVAHEVAHQWFYSTAGNDQWNEPWLDEALAQYMTGLYYEDTYGAAAAAAYRASWTQSWEQIDRAEIPIGLPAGEYKDYEYAPIVYNRGPLFLTELSKKMGNAVFDQFLREYYQANIWGIGTGAEFRQMAERHCQCDLSDLFKEWVYR